jgi:thiol-disulfide isomerase/thioredoxin
LSRLPAGDPLKAKLAARGVFYPAGSDRAQAFHTAFDGRTIRRLDTKERTLVEKVLNEDDPKERSLGFVTSLFGGGAYHLLMFEYVSDEPFAAQLKAPVVDYEGRAAVAGGLCHVVYVEYDLGPKRRIKQRWFIAVKDGLPRKLEELTADDNGRPGAYVLELSGLRANPPPNDSAFTVRAPRGYTVKPYVATPRPALLAAGEAAPAWRLADAEGRTHELSEYRGKLVVLDFWATWCGPCVRAMPEVQRLHEKYRDRNVVVLGLDSWEDSNAAAYMREKGYGYGLLLNGEQTAGAYRVTVLPTFYVIGPDGKILYASTGAADDLEPSIEKYLTELPK